MSIGMMDDYSLSDLAGSTAIILASCGGLLTIILSSRCLIKCRLGCTDECNLCMCERKPPPDPIIEDSQKIKKKEDDIVIVPKKDRDIENVSQPEPEPEEEDVLTRVATDKP